MYVRPASRILTVCGMRHDVKILTNISPIHYLKFSAVVKNLRILVYVCTSSSKLRREVMKHTYSGRVYQTIFFSTMSTMSTVLISSPTGCIIVFQFQHGTNNEAHGESGCCAWSV